MLGMLKRVLNKRAVVALLLLAGVLLWLVVNNSSLSDASFKYLALTLTAIVGIIAIQTVKG